jgi:hypothetical protein
MSNEQAIFLIAIVWGGFAMTIGTLLGISATLRRIAKALEEKR